MSKFGEFYAHPAADAFPYLPSDELRALADDIKAHGQREPCQIATVDGTTYLLDGRNRWLACELAEVEAMAVDVGTMTEAEATQRVISLNLHRRHLNASQRSMVAARLLPQFERGQGARTDLTCDKFITSSGKAREQAGALLNVSGPSVQHAKTVIDKGTPELADAVDGGDIAVSAAAKLVKDLDHEQQAEVVDKVRRQGMTVKEAVAGQSAAFSSVNQEWYTPSEVIEAARTVLGGFDLDPATCREANDRVRATAIYTRQDNGLDRAWNGRVWCNPPYGRDTDNVSNQAKWTRKAVDEHDAGHMSAGIVLVTFSPDRSWFDPLWDYPIAVFSSRLRFILPGGGTGNSPVDANVCIGIGVDFDKFREAFAQFGVVIDPRGVHRA